MSECAEGKRLRERHDAEAAIASELKGTGMAAGRHMQNVAELYRKMMGHWAWCCECRGLAVVEQEPTVEGVENGK